MAELAAAGTRKSEARSDHWGRWTDGDLFRARKLDVEPALHGIEAAIWAAAYVWLGALDSPIEAMLYSVDSMTTPLWGSIALLQIQCDVGRVHRLRKFRGLCSILMVRSPNRSGHLASYRHLLANVCIRVTARWPGTTAMAHSGPRQSVLDARFLDRLAGRPYD